MIALRAEDSGLGVAFGHGHTQKHNSYIFEAVFVGKYRHRGTVGLMSKNPTAQHYGYTVTVWVSAGWLGLAMFSMGLEHSGPIAVQNMGIK